MINKKILLILGKENESVEEFDLNSRIELTPELEEKIRKFVLKETMKEIQELYYDVEEPQEDYDWHCDKGMIKRTILSTIINVFQKLKEKVDKT